MHVVRHWQTAGQELEGDLLKMMTLEKPIEPVVATMKRMTRKMWDLFLYFIIFFFIYSFRVLYSIVSSLCSTKYLTIRQVFLPYNLLPTINMWHAALLMNYFPSYFPISQTDGGERRRWPGWFIRYLGTYQWCELLQMQLPYPILDLIIAFSQHEEAFLQFCRPLIISAWLPWSQLNKN